MTKSIISALFAICIILLDVFVVAAHNAGEVVTSIRKGAYIPDMLLSIKDMRNLPVPLSNENYAFIQSIDDVCNIVIGNFIAGEREIILIQDKNSDGKVDLVVHWFIDIERYKFEPNPDKEYNQESFKKLKEDIINGVRGRVFPNEQGLEYIRVLSQSSGNIKKWRNGFAVAKYDPDIPRQEMLSYFFSIDADGADLVFRVAYIPKNNIKVSPVINSFVYCKNSKDPFIKDVTQELIDETKKLSPYEQ